MNKKILLFGCLFAVCFSATAIVPLKRANGVPVHTKHDVTLPAVNKNVVYKAPMLAESADSVVYAEGFEDADNSWTLYQSSNASERYNGIYIADNIKTTSGSVPAAEGEQYLISDYDPKADVNAWAISNQSVELKAGQEYWLSVFYLAPDDYGAQTLKFTCALSAEVSAHENVLLELGKTEAAGDWTLATKKFTVDADGKYYFGFNHQGPADSWVAAIDYFRITIGDEPQRPAATITGLNIASHNTAWSVVDAKAYVNEKSYSYVAMDATFTDEYAWEISGVDILTDSTGAPYVNDYYTAWSHLESSDVVVKAMANNEIGGDTLTAEFQAFYALTDSTADYIWNWSPTDAPNDHLSLVSVYGPKSHAEVFDALTDDSYAMVNGAGLYVLASYLENYADSILTIRVLGADEEGQPLNNYEFGRYETTFADFLGNGTYVETPAVKMVTFDQPIGVKGRFFVVFDFPQIDTLLYSVDDNYFEAALCYRGQVDPAKSAFYPDSYYSVWGGQWYSYADYSNLIYKTYYKADVADMTSLGLFANVSFGYQEGTKEEPDPEETAIKFVNADSKLAIYPNPAKDVLYISNLASDASAVVTDLTGKQLMSLSHVQNSVSVAGLAQGVYFISIKDAEGVHTAKFVKE